MSTQQDIYAAGFENRPPMLNKENYVSWSSRLLRYAKSRPNGKLIHNFIINGPYVRRMIPEPGDPNHEVHVNETFHVKTDDVLTEKELKQIEADDQAIQTILLGLPEDIYAAVDSCETAQEIWLRVQQMMKGSDIEIQEKKAKLFNEWEMFTSNDGESIKSYYHHFLKLMNDLKRNKHFPEMIANYTQLYDFLKYNQKEVDDLKAERLARTQDPLALMATSNNPYAFSALHQDQPSFNQNYMQQSMPNPEDITDLTTAINMELALMAKAFKLNYSTPTNNNQRISSNPHNRQIAQPGMNMDQDRHMQMVGGNGENLFRQYAGQNVGNLNGYNDVQNVRNQVIQHAVQNLRIQNVVQWNANQNPNGNGNLVAAHAEGNATGHNRNQIRCYNYRGKEEARIQLQAEEFELMAAAAYLDEIEEVNANCILMANLHQALTSSTQTDKALVYDSDGSAEVHNYENCYDDEIFNMFTQEEQYTELLEPIPEPHQVSHNDNIVISEDSSVEQSGRTVEQHPTNAEETHLNKQISMEKSTVSSLLEEKKKLKCDFKIRKDELLDKQNQLEKKIKELDNILVKTGQSIQTIHMLSPKPDSFYHTKQKMALGYQNPFYLKQAQQKQHSLYDGKVLLEKHDPPVVHDSEETLQLAQESRLKVKQLNKEIKPANYTKINHLSGVFVSQMAKSREELYFSNTFKMANASKIISIPNEEFSNDTTPSVARKFLNEVKRIIVTLQRVVKQRMTLETHNWSSSAHQELHKIVKDENFPIVNQVDDKVQNFEIQFLKKATKFVGDFKSLAKEADESLAKHKTLELKIECLLRAVIERLQAQLGDLKGKSKDTSGVSDTLNSLSRKLENENVELEFQVSDQKDTKRGTSVNTKFAKQLILGKPPKVGEIHALLKTVTSNSIPTPQESKVVKNDKVIAPGMFRINPFKPSREEKHVPNNVRSSVRTKSITVSQPPVKENQEKDKNQIKTGQKREASWSRGEPIMIQHVSNIVIDNHPMKIVRW
nr:hypothetical protein [Tanacetum cinerariifolium]